MSWLCPNCSNSNGDELTSCFVCGMTRPVGIPVTDSSDADYKIVFSDFEALKESVSQLFKRSADSRARSKSIGTSKRKTDRSAKRVARSSSSSKSSGTDISASDFARPWPEHKIAFDYEAIRGKGFIRSEQKSMGGINGYFFYKEDGSKQFIRCEVLLIQKMARKT